METRDFNALGTDVVRTTFGDITPRITKISDDERTCVTLRSNGYAGSYSITKFNPEVAERFTEAHKAVKDGEFIGESFRSIGVPFEREENCTFIYPTVSKLQELFGTNEVPCFVKEVKLKVGVDKEHYATTIELYSPPISFGKLEETCIDGASAVADILDNHFSSSHHYFIKKVQKRDLEKYLQIAHEFLKKPMHVGISDKELFVRETLNTGIDLINDSNTVLLVAQEHDDFIGYIATNIHPALHINGKEGMVRELYIKEEKRRKGLGSALIKSIERIALAQGAKRISLATDMGNPSQHSFYSSQGYFRRCDFITKKLR